MEKMTIGQRIASRRKLANLSQESISQQIGVSRQSVSKWESDAGLPDIDNLIAMSKIFGVSVGWLLGTEQDPGFDPSTGLSDAQLRMVEKVVSGIKPKRWPVFLVVILSVVVIAESVLFPFMLSRVRKENSEANIQLNTLENQISDMNSILLQQKDENELLLNAFAIAHLNDDAQNVTIDFYMVPKLFQEKAQAYISVQNDPYSSWNQLECHSMGRYYHCRTVLPVKNGYSYSFILANDSGFKEQQLNEDRYLGFFGDLYDMTRYRLDRTAKTRTTWDQTDSVYTFSGPIGSPFITFLTSYVGYKAIDITLYLNDAPIYTESLKEAFRNHAGAYMRSEEPLYVDIRTELPSLSEGDKLRLEITSLDYHNDQKLTNTLEELIVTSNQN